ncbi:sensor histidine kinase [Bacillus gobiensis]|uniref:sensor histidine kinase n=1 Tax=Bacillus gobiensis TaxID=1441095 RepID=UPI003D212698
MAAIKKFRLFPKKYGIMPYVFLIYLLMPIVYMSNAEGAKKVVGYILLFLFVVTYRQLYVTVEKGFSFWLVLQLLIVFSLIIFYHPYNLFIGFFTAHFIGWYSENKHFFIAWAGFIVSNALAIAIISHQLETVDLLTLIPFLIIMFAIPFGFRSIDKRNKIEQQLAQANERIEELVKQEERMRISRDLHDTLGHTLSLITLKSQLVGKLIAKNPEKAEKEAKEIEITSRTALQQVRELVSGMRTLTLTLEEELVHMKAFLQSAGISFRYEGDKKFSDISHLTQNTMSLCLREVTTNVVKHSRATQCFVRIKKGKAGIKLEVSDNGIGVDFMKDRAFGNGLKGIDERLSLVDGSLTLTSDKGTSLMIEVPFIVKQRQDAADL